MASAITALKGVITDANANASVAIPEDWLQISGLTMADLAKITHGLVARWTAGVARTPTGVQLLAGVMSNLMPLKVFHLLL